ncbi:hypothetical protein JNW90_13735 [Micromonospora sp. STR1s_5]|nr:hypothetical protein [Micromonospora sp. STR1s_5]
MSPSTISTRELLEILSDPTFEHDIWSLDDLGGTLVEIIRQIRDPQTWDEVPEGSIH